MPIAPALFRSATFLSGSQCRGGHGKVSQRCREDIRNTILKGSSILTHIQMDSHTCYTHGRKRSEAIALEPVSGPSLSCRARMSSRKLSDVFPFPKRGGRCGKTQLRNMDEVCLTPGSLNPDQGSIPEDPLASLPSLDADSSEAGSVAGARLFRRVSRPFPNLGTCKAANSMRKTSSSSINI